MKILVTGGGGFIGSHLVDKLIENDHEVTILDNLSTGFKKNINSKAKFPEKRDINNSHLKTVFERECFDVIYHLAAQIDVRKSIENPIEDIKENIIGSLKIIELAKEHNAKFIFSSTGGAIYGDTDLRPTKEDHPEKPMSPYGLNKLYIDKYLDQISKINYVSLRYSNVYGPRQSPLGEAGVVSIFLNKMLKGEQPIINGDGSQTRDYVYVEDVVDANILALSLPNGIYNVGTGIETNVNELFNKINNFFNYKFKEIHAPPKQGEQKTSCLNCDKIKKFGWKPETSLAEGLKKTYEWFTESLNN